MRELGGQVKQCVKMVWTCGENQLVEEDNGIKCEKGYRGF